MRIIIGLLLALPNVAIGCEELWFFRNLIFDRAGYCFETPLGQAVFDNADCTTSTPVLSQTLSDRVALIRLEEGYSGCNIDPDVGGLPPDLTVAAWAEVETLPLPTGFESACVYWLGAALELRASQAWTPRSSASSTAATTSHSTIKTKQAGPLSSTGSRTSAAG